MSAFEHGGGKKVPSKSVVVDFIDKGIESALAERTVGLPVRIVLLARSAGSWQSLLRDRDDRVTGLFASVPEHRLRPLTDEVDRRGEFDRAVRAFSVAHDRQMAGPVAVPPDLDDERYERALDIHAAALASLLDLEVPGTATVWNDPIMRVRDHEERYWLATTDAYALTEPHLSRLREAVSAATLFGAAYADVARTLLAGLPTFADFEGDRVERYRRWLAAMYPGESALNPVRPDRLGEDLVAMTLADQANMAAAVSPSLNETQLVRALTVLGRSASHHAHLRPVMHDLLSGSAANRVPVGMAVATQLEDETLISVLTDISENDHELAESVVDHLPDQSLTLAVFAVVRTRAALEHERRKPEPDEETVAWLAVRMAIRLGALEQTGEALSYAIDAVQRYRALAIRDPAFESDLANALNTLAGAFDSADLPEDAPDAADDSVRWLRRLSGNDPELRLILSTALMTRSNVLSGLARHEDALTALTEAVDIQHDLLDLQNLSVIRAEIGLAREALDAAETAVGIFRELAEHDPDAFGGELVHCEGNLATVYGLLGDWEHAHQASDQAIQLARDLVTRHGEAHLEYLATALTNASAAVRVLDRPEDGVAYLDEAVAIFQQRLDKWSGTALRGLADALQNLGNCLSDLGDAAAALDAYEESADIYRKLVDPRPDALEPDLAEVLFGLAHALHDLGRLADARSAADEAVEIFSRHVDRGRARLRLRLAESQHLLGVLCLDLREPDRSAAAAARAADELTTLIDGEGAEDHLPLNRAHALHLRGKALDAGGHHQEAVRVYEEALAHFGRVQLDEAGDEAVAEATQDLALCLSGLGEHTAALARITEAVRLRRDLLDGTPDSVAELSVALYNLADTLCDLDRRDDALDPAREALRLAEKARRAGYPEADRAYLYALARHASLLNPDDLAIAVGQLADAFELAQGTEDVSVVLDALADLAGRRARQVRRAWRAHTSRPYPLG